MFGDKKKMIAELESRLSAEKSKKAQSAEKIDEGVKALGENRKEMDDIIGSIVDTTKSNEAVGERILHSIEELENAAGKDNGLSDYREAVEKCVDTYREGVEAIKNDITSINGPKTEIVKAKDNMLSSVNAASSRLENIKNDAHQMAVISLNAAIEAGKLGPEGKGFLIATETIRSTAEGYENKLDAVIADMKSAAGKIEQMGMFIDSMNDIIKALDEDATGIKADIPDAGAFITDDSAEKTETVNRQVKESVDDLKYNIEKVLESMESLGNCFVKMQEIEEDLAETKNKLTD